MGCTVHALLDTEEIVSKSIASPVRIKFVESTGCCNPLETTDHRRKVTSKFEFLTAIPTVCYNIVTRHICICYLWFLYALTKTVTRWCFMLSWYISLPCWNIDQ